MSALLERADELTLTARQRVPGADAGFQAFQREVAYGGGLLAGQRRSEAEGSIRFRSW